MSFTKEEYIINQRMYKNIDRRTRPELIQLRMKIRDKYNKVFSSDSKLTGSQFQKVERIMYKADNRIVENLKVWR